MVSLIKSNGKHRELENLVTNDLYHSGSARTYVWFVGSFNATVPIACFSEGGKHHV